jgi:hypothetical protein
MSKGYVVMVETYSLELITSNRLQRLEPLHNLEGLPTANQVRASVDKTSPAGLAQRKKVKPGLGDSLDNVLLSHATISNALEGLDRLPRSRPDVRCRAADLDGEKASIGVGKVGSLGVGTRGRGSRLREEAEAGGPLDVGLAAEQADENSNLRLASTEGGAGKADYNGVAAKLGNSGLTAVILGRRLGELLLGLSRDLLKEGLDPLAEGRLARAISHHRDVGLGVSSLGVCRDIRLVKVGSDRSVRSRVEGIAKAIVEGDGVSGIEGDGGSVDIALLVANKSLNLLAELVSYKTA